MEIVSIRKHLARKLQHGLRSGWLRFLRSQRRPNLGEQIEAWIPRLQEEKSYLNQLMGEIEKEFLETGGGLRQLILESRVVQGQCQELIDMTMGKQQDSAVQFAYQLLKRAEDLVLASYDQYEHVFNAFRELRARLSNIARLNDELNRILFPLQFITLQFRVEASRHAEQIQGVFCGLAHELSSLIQEVRRTLDQQFEELAGSEKMSRSLMEGLARSVSIHRQEIAATLNQSRRDLLQLEATLQQSGKDLTEISRLNQMVFDEIGRVMMAQQCQDIIRQKVEHVGEAMEAMCRQMREHRDFPENERAGIFPYVAQAAQIQRKQLEDVFGELAKAGESIAAGLQQAKTSSSTATALVLKIGHEAMSTGVGQNCQQSIRGILGIIEETVHQTSEILQSINPLQTQFVNCTAKATDLAVSIQYAALNAQIFAIHVEKASSFEVLAARTQVISSETIQQVEQLSGLLTHTAEIVRNLEQRLLDFQELGQREKAILSEESALSRKKLAELEENLPLFIRSIAGRQPPLNDFVNTAIGRIQFPQAAAQAARRSLGLVDELRAWSEAAVDKSALSPAVADQINLLKNTYTMEKERMTHDEVVAKEPTSPVAELTPKSDLGNNVELF